jgi:hypothetical protein
MRPTAGHIAGEFINALILYVDRSIEEVIYLLFENKV